MMNNDDLLDLSRRGMLRFGLRVGGAGLFASTAMRPQWALGQTLSCGAAAGVIEEFPTSPLILQPFIDQLPIPTPLAPSDPASWPVAPNCIKGGQQDCDGGTHQLGYKDLGLPAPVYYRIELKVAPHSFTSSPVLPIDANGRPVQLPPGATVAQNTDGSVSRLPDSTIYGFNGAFPGPMIYARYGQPVSVRFVNRLGENPYNLQRQNFGVEEFCTHLHNAHTAPESDGNPHYKPTAYEVGGWCDNLYLNYPAGGDDGEKQSTLWFHDHRMDHTGSNVYKGMVGLYPIYDTGKDDGDETKGFRLPGVPNATTGRVDYDIPLAFYDCRLEDGRTRHQDYHNGCGETHPEWWGKTFFRHFPNHGFVGDIFTVNGKAYPVVRVKRRRYRLRLLDASIARCYELMFMSSRSGPVAARDLGLSGTELQGQYRLLDGQQCLKMAQIASEGGLLTYPLLRSSVEIWPGKRREVIVDFSKYMDGSPTCSAGKEEVIYLVNVLQMSDGRLPDKFNTDPKAPLTYQVPLMKVIIEPGAVTDNSVDPFDYTVKDPVDGFCTLKINKSTKLPALKMRDLPALPKSFTGVPTFKAELQRSGGYGGEIEWLINGRPFDPTQPMAFPTKGSAGLWTIRNGGGGWVHPMHLHMEEHRIISRNGVLTPVNTNPAIYAKTYFGHTHIDDVGKEDVIALDPSEEVVIYRKFRTFTGPFVAHCHNLAHEDHAMMFGFKIV